MPVIAPSAIQSGAACGNTPAAFHNPAPLNSALSPSEVDRWLQSLGTVHIQSKYYALLEGSAALESKLAREARRQPNWNSYGAPPPNAEAVNLTRMVLRLLREDGMLPRQLTASAEGGLALCFTEKNRYAEIEILNTGDISVSMYERYSDAPAVILDVEPQSNALRDTIRRIHTHQFAMPS